MVTRKPLNSGPPSGPAPAPDSSSLPYPVTPVSTNAPPSFRMQDARNELGSPTDSEPESAKEWSEEANNRLSGGELPSSSLEAPRTGPIYIPKSLRTGPPGYSPDTSQEMLRPGADVTIPYLQNQRRAQQGTLDGRESSASAWGGFPERPAPPAPSAPEDLPPAEKFASLSISEPSTNPWQPALSEEPPHHTSSTPPIQRHDSGNEAWLAAPPSRQVPPIPTSVDTAQEPVLVDIPDEDFTAWDEDEDGDGDGGKDEDEPSPVGKGVRMENEEESHQIFEERHAWSEDQGQNIGQKASAASQPLAQIDPGEQGEMWNVVNRVSAPPLQQESGIIEANGIATQTNAYEQPGPALPPRRSQEQPPPPPQPQRLLTDTTDSNTSSAASRGISLSAARAQKKETYEIKKVTWHDFRAADNPRVSPILVQNANGPCPLMALVNALTLSTPADVETALVDTLRSRERISLGLLLDAVFDELMSGRRGDAAQELPDVGDLYSFLITLHTGMNVNPQFFPPAETKSAKDPRNSMSHIHPSEREAAIPGTFEDTREMRLYSTFSIPLIHGWLPENGSAAYAALSRSARSYEDAQNLMFHEEELEDKLQREGLSFEEQATLEDIATINTFFNTAATQLTPSGLDTITISLAPGAIAILFRNDHFSTLYRHPDTLQLLQLVTDMGYSGHEEVVWESLTDVNGESAEFFSGDFRLVGGAPAASSHGSEAPGWTTVSGRRSSNNNQSQNLPTVSTSSTNRPNAAPPAPQSPSIEQEDHDLALALQLQEEEEERHRNEIARRRRETELSQQYIEQQGSSIPVNSRSGGRGGGRGQNTAPSNGAPQLRPAIPPRRTGTGGQRTDLEAGVDAPPPSYEQAATQSPYVPPVNHPAHPNASPNQHRRISAYSANSAGVTSGNSGSNWGGRQVQGQGRTGSFGRGFVPVDQIIGRRHTGQGVSQQQQQDKDKDCVVM